MFGVINCGLKEVAPRQAAEALVQLGPSIDNAGDGYRVDALLRHLFCDALRFQTFDGECFRRPSACVEAIKLAGLRFPVDGEEVASHSVGRGLGDVKNGVGRNGRVDGRAALLENARPGLRGRDLAGGDDAKLSSNNGAAVGTVLRVE